ncbi:MAG: DsrE family protein [Bacteroidota bacterium]
MKRFTIFFIIANLILGGLLLCQNLMKVESSSGNDSIKAISTIKQQQLILWTSGDREVALKMVFMYAYYCKKNSWMDNVRLLVWGPSSKLLAEDTVLQEKLKDLKQVGVELYACKACADLYGVSDRLTQLGITVMYTGEMLAELQKSGWHVIAI